MKYFFQLTILFFFSNISFASEWDSMDNKFWNLSPSPNWTYSEKYNVSYITKNDSILLIFKDHNGDYGLFYFNKNDSNKNEHQLFFKIDEGDYKSYESLSYGSSITISNTFPLVNQIRRKNTISVTPSILFADSTTFNLINSYDSIGLLKPSHPSAVLLNDIYLNRKSFDDIVHTGIQLVKTDVGINNRYPHGFVEQWFEVDINAHDINYDAYPKIILNYKRKECKNKPYLWEGDISYILNIRIKKNAEVINQSFQYLCLVE